MNMRRTLLTIAVGGMILSLPATIPTAIADEAKVTSDHSRYSDRDRIKSSKDQKEHLTQVLKVGEEKPFYRRELEKMGWQITSINYDKPDYLEYEIVKADKTFEVQVNFDNNSHKSTKVDVAWNGWQTDATKEALKEKKKIDHPKTASNPKLFSDRDQKKSSKNDKEKLEKVLKTGEEKAFYRRELEKMGWHITSVNYDKPDYAEYEIVKGDKTFEVQVDFDKNSHKATKVDVTSNIWKADATENALKQAHARR
jgi:uncharacterized protein YmfQ (DUF2313 family)